MMIEPQTSAKVAHFQIGNSEASMQEPAERPLKELPFWELGSLVPRFSCAGWELGSLVPRFSCVGWELGSLVPRLSCVGWELGSLIPRLSCVGWELGSLVLTINLRSSVYPRQWPPTHPFQKRLQKTAPYLTLLPTLISKSAQRYGFS